jgi:hypothetical protein
VLAAAVDFHKQLFTFGAALGNPLALLRLVIGELPSAFDKLQPAHRRAMIVPQGEVPREEFSRVCDPVIGCGIARAGDPDDNMVVLNLDHEAFAQQWLSLESEPLLFWFNGGRARTFPSTPSSFGGCQRANRVFWCGANNLPGCRINPVNPRLLTLLR